MIVLIKLLLAHIIGDFVLQTPKWFKDKTEYKWMVVKVCANALIHGLMILIIFWDLTYWSMSVFIVAAHLLIEGINKWFLSGKSITVSFFVKQFSHILIILILWNLYYNPFTDWHGFINNSLIWAYATAMIFVTVASGIIIKHLLKPWTKDLFNNEKNSLNTLPNAGYYIGMLERLFVFIFIVSGRWEAMGFLLAAKSVFRFGDLKEAKDVKLTEYILIGTLLSFGMAMLSGILFLKVISLI